MIFLAGCALKIHILFATVILLHGHRRKNLAISVYALNFVGASDSSFNYAPLFRTFSSFSVGTLGVENMGCSSGNLRGAVGGQKRIP